MLSDRLDGTIAGAGGLVAVTGEAGIGKTRMCEELAAVARSRGAAVAWAACPEAGGLPPFWPWWQLLDQLGRRVELAADGSDAPDVARARLFSSVIDALRAAALTRPLVLVLDDVQWADPGTRAMLEHAGPLVRALAVLLLVTVREPDDGGAPVRAPDVLRLGGLGVEALDELVDRLTGASRPAVAAALRDVTEGNPLFATEVVRRLHGEGRLDGLVGADVVPVSPTVRAALGARLGDVGGRCRELLAVAAVIGREFPVPQLARVVGRDPLDVLGDLEEAVSARVLAEVSAGRYAFAHPLLRSVMYDDIGVARRVALHRQVAEELEAAAEHGYPVDPAALSLHYAHSAPSGTAGKAVHHAERAARVAMDTLGYEDAVAHYERALDALDLDPTAADRGRLLLGVGAARTACGDGDGARAAYLAAAEHARGSGRPADLAAAALGLAGTGFEVGLFDDRQIALLEEALDGLDDGETALRSLVSARLSVALSLAGQERRRAALSDEAVQLAHCAGDAAALGQALAARCDAHAGPGEVALRAADAARIVHTAREQGDRDTELLGRRLRLVAALEIGDIAAADAEIHGFATVADRLGQPRYRWYVPLWRAMRAAMRGDLAAQRVLADEADALGSAGGSVNTSILMLSHRWFAWLEAGEVEAALAGAEVFFPPGAYADRGVQMVPFEIGHRLLAGRPDEARALLDGVADAVRVAERDSEWLTTLAQLADACFRLGGHDLAGWLAETLRPFADLWAVEGIGVYVHGPVHRYLGLLAALLGRPADASVHFDAAVAGNRRAGADLLVARTLYDRGVALDEADTLRAAQEAYRALGVQRRVTELDALLDGRAGPSTPPDAAELRRVGAVWHVRFGPRRSVVRDAKGVRDLARLLARPGHEIAALDLMSDGGTVVAADAGETVDARARAAYRARLVELEAELDEADACGDGERSTRAQAERDVLLAELAGAYGLAGRPRRGGGSAERARTAVTARIRDAIRRIESDHPELGRHLARSVRTGTFCCYDPDQPVRWQL